MDGLIPLVYKAIKRTKTRRQYKCISLGGSTAKINYDIADFYPENHHQLTYLTPPPPPEKFDGFHEKSDGSHRRHKSVSELSSAGGGGGVGGGYFSPEKMHHISIRKNEVEVVRRFRSQRGMLSCLSGC